jgi:hypothetical protein
VLSERESAPLRMLSAQTTSRDVCGFTSDPHFFPTRTFFPLLELVLETFSISSFAKNPAPSANFASGKKKNPVPTEGTNEKSTANYFGKSPDRSNPWNLAVENVGPSFGSIRDPLA